MVSSSSLLTLWFSWVTLTASTTNSAEPVTQSEMATMVARFMLRPWSLVLTTVVMTRAIAPIGCTTVNGRHDEGDGVHPHPDAQQQEPENPARIAREPQQAVGAQRQAAGIGLDRAALALGAKGQAEGAEHRKQNRKPDHQREPPSCARSCLPLPMMAQT